MTVADLKHQIKELSEAERDEIFTWLAREQEDRDEAYLDKITQLVDDRDPSRWHTAEQFKQILENE